MPSNSKRINITEHAAERYLQRIAGLPTTEANVRAARLFLRFTLANRVCPVVAKDVTASWTRISILHKGAVIAYDPADRTVYSVKPAKGSREKLEMYMHIPADFSVGPSIRPGSKLHGRLFRHKWPIIEGWSTSLRLQVCGTLVDVDFKKKIVTLPSDEAPAGAQIQIPSR